MIEFIKCNETDINKIRALAEKSWNSAYSTILSEAQIEYMLDQMYSESAISLQMKNPNYNYYLIKKDNDEAGFIGFEFHYEPNTTKLHRIYLLEEYKGEGLGKKSLQFLKSRVVESADHRIILNVNKDNPAKFVYVSQGYQVYDEGIFDIGNGFVMDDFLMELKW